MFKTILAILLGKTIFFLSRILKLGGGYAAPGLYALKVDPNLVKNLINPNAKNIVVTGTNGKTTTAKLISHFLKTLDNRVIRNSSGSNLERGIASYLVNHASLFGKLDYDFGVWEVDEFAFNSLAPKIKPDVIILLNAFRDQLDRYGEVDTVVNKWKETLGKLSEKTVLILNNDDAILSKAVSDFKGKIVRIGIKGSKIKGEGKIQRAEKPDYEAEVLKSSTLEENEIQVEFNGSRVEYSLPLPGIFNAYNFLASFTLAYMLNIDPEFIKNSLKSFKSSFGRFEKFNAQGKEGNIFLIKNPVGATQVLQTVLPHISKDDSLLVALNDNFADGTDVSWIWDIELERFQIQNSKFQIHISGSRAYDMALRLKYAGLDESNMIINQDLETAFDKAIKETKGKLFVLPTYTALMELQKILVKKGIKKEYWKE
jgi:lipid II isoglutaminyl synthase (glutamine-hydrolysing)